MNKNERSKRRRLKSVQVKLSIVLRFFQQTYGIRISNVTSFFRLHCWLPFFQSKGLDARLEVARNRFRCIITVIFSPFFAQIAVFELLLN